MARLWLVFFICVTFARVEASEAPQFEAQLQSDVSSGLTIGDQLIFFIDSFPGEIDLSYNEKIRFESLDSKTPLSQQGWYVLPSVQKRDHRLYFFALPLTNEAKTLPALAAKNQDGKILFTIKEQNVDVKVQNVDLGEQQQPYDFFPAIKLHFPLGVAAGISMLGLVLFTAVVWLLIKYIQRKSKNKKTFTPPVIQKTEYEIALQKLRQLESDKPWLKGQFKPYYFEISEILKEYLSRRYGIDALESTTSELLELLEKSAILSAEKIDQIDSLFKKLDRVKFTDYKPESTECTDIIGSAKNTVEQTKRAGL